MSAARDLLGTIKALHQARLDEGASLDVVARRIGVSAQALDQWERRQVLPRPEHIFAWAKAFGKRLRLVDANAVLERENPDMPSAGEIDLRRMLADVMSEIVAIKEEFGAPGDHGYGTDLGTLLFRLYRMGLPISSVLDRVAP